MNQIQTVSITGYSSGGEGVARLGDGRVVFVHGAVRGDVCKIAAHDADEKARSLKASIARIIEPSKHRTIPDCEHYPQCGGCDFRHITYEEELYAKVERINNALSRIGKTELRAEKILTAGNIDGYRNKATFHIARQGGGTVIGFNSAKSNEVCAVRHCRLLCNELNDELTKLWKQTPDTETVAIRVGNAVLDEGIQADAKARPAGIRLGELTFRVSPASFFQVNNEAALILCGEVCRYAALTKSESLVDLYCGAGLFTLFAGQDAGRALGVESSKAAIEDARHNAKLNGFSHIEFVCADAAKWSSGGVNPACAIVDPPRKGLSKQAVSKILELSPSRVVYVSCDPATMARDISRLSGYAPRSISAVDMFPRTANIECCVLLERL